MVAALDDSTGEVLADDSSGDEAAQCERDEAAQHIPQPFLDARESAAALRESGARAPVAAPCPRVDRQALAKRYLVRALRAAFVRSHAGNSAYELAAVEPLLHSTALALVTLALEPPPLDAAPDLAAVEAYWVSHGADATLAGIVGAALHARGDKRATARIAAVLAAHPPPPAAARASDETALDCLGSEAATLLSHARWLGNASRALGVQVPPEEARMIAGLLEATSAARVQLAAVGAKLGLPPPPAAPRIPARDRSWFAARAGDDGGDDGGDDNDYDDGGELGDGIVTMFVDEEGLSDEDDRSASTPTAIEDEYGSA